MEIEMKLNIRKWMATEIVGRNLHRKSWAWSDIYGRNGGVNVKLKKIIEQKDRWASDWQFWVTSDFENLQ